MTDTLKGLIEFAGKDFEFDYATRFAKYYKLTEESREGFTELSFDLSEGIGISPRWCSRIALFGEHYMIIEGDTLTGLQSEMDIVLKGLLNKMEAATTDIRNELEVIWKD